MRKKRKGKMSKPKWEKEMEEYINGMSTKEFDKFLEETKYEFYKNVKTPLMGIPELDSLDDPPLDLSLWGLTISWQQALRGILAEPVSIDYSALESLFTQNYACSVDACSFETGREDYLLAA